MLVYDHIEIEGSPFKIAVDVEGEKHTKVKCYGTGLTKGKLGVINNIFIDFKDSGIFNIFIYIQDLYFIYKPI